MLRRLLITPLSSTALLAASFVSFADDHEREVFQVTFGTRTYLGQSSPTTDGGQLLVAADNGDIVVAGHGASTFTDTGDRTKPMFARIDPGGRVRWKRIYDDLLNHDVMAMLPGGNRQYVVFKYLQQGESAENPAPRERISVHALDKDGDLSRELGSIDDLYTADVLAYQNDAQAGFLVTALVTTGATFESAFQRDLTLFDLQASGTVNRPPFPKGIKGARLLQRDADGELVFLRLDTFFGEPTGFVRLTVDGLLQPLFDVDNGLLSPMQLIATDDRIFVFEASDWRAGFTPVTAFSNEGEIAWKKEIHGVSRFSEAIRQGDNLLIAGSYENNPVLVKLTLQGDRVWTRRFRSAKKDARIAKLEVLPDGWLAVTGSTSPGSGVFVSTDSDAFVAVADPEGKGFEEFGTCMADWVEIEALRKNLAARAGLEVRREVLVTGRRPTPADELPPLDEPLPKTLDCGDLSEHDLLQFLRGAADEASKLDLSKPSERVKIHVLLRPEGAIPVPGYKESDRYGFDAVPSLEVNENRAAAAMQFIADEILPYTERMHAVADELRAETGMWVGEASSHNLAGGLPPFKENTLVTERFLDLFQALNAADRANVRARFGDHPLVVAANKNVLHLWGDRWILVGADRIDEVFAYLLNDLPMLEARIQDSTSTLRRNLNLHVRKSDPDLFHSDYLDVLEKLIVSSKQLTKDDAEIIRSLAADVHVSRDSVSDIFLQEESKMIYIDPVAAPHFLQFLVDVEDQLQEQESGWE